MPPCACSIRPIRFTWAPVNDPFSWPKSSDSMISRGIAPQLSATNARGRRGELWWRAPATSSLPVPDSPVTRTVVRVGATTRSLSKRSSMGLETPRIASKPYRLSSRSRRFLISPACRARLSAADALRRRSSLAIGLAT